RIDQPGQITIDELALQRDGGRRHDNGGVVAQSVHDRGDQIGERLAGAGAGLYDEVLVGREGLRHRGGHLLLAAAFAAAERGHGGGQQLGHGHVGRGHSLGQARICVVVTAGSPCDKFNPSHGRLRSPEATSSRAAAMFGLDTSSPPRTSGTVNTRAGSPTSGRWPARYRISSVMMPELREVRSASLCPPWDSLWLLRFCTARPSTSTSL